MVGFCPKGAIMDQSKITVRLLSGRPFTPEEIRYLQETVRVFRYLCWKELLRTICEHLQWVTPAGRYKLDSCAKALLKLQARGLLHLPAKRPQRMRQRQIVFSSATDGAEDIVGSVRDIAPLTLEPVRGKDRIALWNEYVHRYHPLGYKQPFGAHQRYFIRGVDDRCLGCLLFAASAWALTERDVWIGWTERDRAQRLNWVVANTRFLLFPWVHIRNLASKALSLAAARIGEDWQQRYGYRPVLLETFVEAERYAGTCYQAANWIRLGTTAGRGRMDRHVRHLSTPKVIYVYPLAPDFRTVLRGEKPTHKEEGDGQAEPPVAQRATEATTTRPQGGGPQAAGQPGCRRTDAAADHHHIQRDR